MSLIIGLLWVTSSLELVIDCMGAVESGWFVVRDSILGASGIFFDSSDVLVIV